MKTKKEKRSLSQFFVCFLTNCRRALTDSSSLSSSYLKPEGKKERKKEREKKRKKERERKKKRKIYKFSKKLFSRPRKNCVFFVFKSPGKKSKQKVFSHFLPSFLPARQLLNEKNSFRSQKERKKEEEKFSF